MIIEYNYRTKVNTYIMNYLKYLLPLFIILTLTSCKEEETTSIYSPELIASSDIKIEINKFKSGFKNYSTIIDTTTVDARLDYAVSQYNSFYKEIPTLKKLVEEKAYNNNWPYNYSSQLAEEERLKAVEYIIVIDSMYDATGKYLTKVNELVDRDGAEYLYLYNSCKSFIDNLDFSLTSYADISYKYTKLKRGELVNELAYFQTHQRKADVDFFLENAARIEQVWDFYDVTFINYINRSNFSQLTNSTNEISSTLQKVNSLANSQVIYDSLFFQKSYNPLENKLITYPTLVRFASKLPSILKANNYIDYMYDYIDLLETNVDSVMRNVDTIQVKLPDSEMQQQYLAEYTMFYPERKASLQTAFEFPVIINELFDWSNDFKKISNQTATLYTLYADKDTITNSVDRSSVLDIRDISNSLAETYIAKQYQAYFSSSFSDLNDVYNIEFIGGKIFYLEQLIE